jgi:hypothetical protein
MSSSLKNKIAEREFMKKEISVVLIVFLLIQTGCASIVSGRSQDVNIRTNPPGAEIYINDVSRGATPLMANLKRKQRHSVRFVKEGYVEETRTTGKGFNWWFAGNILFGGIIGIIIDFATGAVYKVSPEDLNVTLVESGAGLGASAEGDVKAAAEQAQEAAVQEVQAKEPGANADTLKWKKASDDAAN